MRGCRALHRNWGHRPVRLCREARGLRRPGSSGRTERRSGLRKRDKQKGKPLYPVCAIRMRDCCNPRWEGSPAGRLFDRLKAKGKHRKAPLRSPVCFGLVAIVHGCWSNGERFDPQHKERLKAPQEQKGRMTRMNRIEIPARTETCRLRSPNEKLLKGRRLPRHRRAVAPRIVVRAFP